MVVASGIILALAFRFADPIPPLVVAWALVAIGVKFPDQPAMLGVGALMVIVLLGSVGVLLWRKGSSRRAA